ncbi:MAG: PP2C family protein-serine/threonine phosphatase [Bacteroidetes bacterium]|nr:PP2C family protein-serine/threonine phosphatase [Bacteroidota bacterium]
MTATKAQPEQRRSLLRRSRPRAGEEKRMPMWKSLLIGNGIAIVFSIVAQLVVTGSLEHPLETIVIGMLFCTSIGSLAHISWWAVSRIQKGVVRTLTLVLAWGASGILGSMFAFLALGLILGDRFVMPQSITDSIPVGNGLVAIGIGAAIFLFELIRSHYAQRSTLLREQNQLTAEFQAARNVQRSLLPADDLVLPGFDISGTTEPAVEIGGDYYDYVSLADGTKGILVADAAGKGVPAALLMAKFQGMAQALSIHVSSPLEFFTGLNDTLTIRLDRKSFITLGMITIDFDDRCAFYRAGHNPLLLYRSASDSVEVCRPRGMALGLTHGSLAGAAIEPAPFVMEPGDIALLYSDGLTEATDPSGEPFGDERTIETLRIAASMRLTALQTRASIMQRLSDFVGTAEPHDDITLVVIRRV